MSDERSHQPVRGEVWDIERIIPYDNNAKIHDKDQVKRIVE